MVVSTWFGNAFFAAVAWVPVTIALAGYVVQPFRAEAALSGPSPADRPQRPPVNVPMLSTAWALLPAILLPATNPTAPLFAELRDVALTTPWYDSTDTWRDLALSIAPADQAGRVTTATVSWTRSTSTSTS